MLIYNLIPAGNVGLVVPKHLDKLEEPVQA
jgi:hypothetical protein